jgi:hypothetical protein
MSPALSLTELDNRLDIRPKEGKCCLGLAIIIVVQFAITRSHGKTMADDDVRSRARSHSTFTFCIAKRPLISGS